VSAESTGTLNTATELPYSVFSPEAQIGEEIKSLETSPPINPASSLSVPRRLSNGTTEAADKKNKEFACRLATLKTLLIVSNAIMNSNINLTL
jgi:hypothetical protein